MRTYNEYISIRGCTLTAGWINNLIVAVVHCLGEESGRLPPFCYTPPTPFSLTIDSPLGGLEVWGPLCYTLPAPSPSRWSLYPPLSRVGKCKLGNKNGAKTVAKVSVNFILPKRRLCQCPSVSVDELVR